MTARTFFNLARGGNRARTLRDRLRIMVRRDAEFVASRLPEDSPRRRPSLAPVRLPDDSGQEQARDPERRS
jgi:hypothetical protein